MKLFVALTIAVAVFSSRLCYSFDGSVHEQITYASIAVFNECLELEPEFKAIYEIQSKELQEAMATKNKNEDGTLFTYHIRFGNWHFYNTNDVSDSGWPNHFMGKIFAKIIKKFDKALSAGKPLEDLYVKASSVMHYIQDVSSPPHVVPVYHWKILGMGVVEPFDGFELNEKDRMTYRNKLDVTPGQCRVLMAGDSNLKNILANDALETLAVIDKKIPVENSLGEQSYKWSSFWRLAGSDEPACDDKKPKPGFGTYGQFCNKYGTSETLTGDSGDLEIPEAVYKDFFLSQFIQARNSSVKVLSWVMRKSM